MKSDRCPTTGLACSVAYRKKKCRCTRCKAHRAKAERRRLRSRWLDALTVEFIQAVKLDPHYLIDIIEAAGRLPARTDRAEQKETS